MEESSKILTTSCVKMLNNKLKSKEAIINFFADMVDAGDGEEVIKLVSLMKHFPPPICSNCRNFPCLSGTDITSSDQVMVGTVVVPNPNVPKCTYGNDMTSWGKTSVVLKSESALEVEPGNGRKKFRRNPSYPIICHDTLTFRFSCH